MAANMAEEHLAIVHNAERNDNSVQNANERIHLEYCKYPLFDSII